MLNGSHRDVYVWSWPDVVNVGIGDKKEKRYFLFKVYEKVKRYYSYVSTTPTTTILFFFIGVFISIQ